MSIIKFPDINQADEHGLLAVGGDLEVSSLLLAYKNGIFPWPISNHGPMTWFTPDPRGILLLKDFHIPRSLKKVIKKKPYEIKYNTNFPEVIHQCALSKNRNQSEPETWINHEIIKSYIDLFHAGYAYSIEAYDGDYLVGGMYGVTIAGFISGESMFYTEDNASKLCFVELMQKLQAKKVAFLDTQMTTAVVKSFGGAEIPRENFMQYLKAALAQNISSLF